jgi:hypothetical protein
LVANRFRPKPQRAIKGDALKVPVRGRQRQFAGSARHAYLPGASIVTPGNETRATSAVCVGRNSKAYSAIFEKRRITPSANPPYALLRPPDWLLTNRHAGRTAHCHNTEYSSLAAARTLLARSQRGEAILDDDGTADGAARMPDSSAWRRCRQRSKSILGFSWVSSLSSSPLNTVHGRCSKYDELCAAQEHGSHMSRHEKVIRLRPLDGNFLQSRVRALCVLTRPSCPFRQGRRARAKCRRRRAAGVSHSSKNTTFMSGRTRAPTAPMPFLIRLRPQLQSAMAGDTFEVIVIGQHRQSMANAELRQQSIDRSNLEAGAATTVP